jgi:redox-sensitive bicupin YhaK (pirin superfamily)
MGVRSVKTKLTATKAMEGGGFPVRRPFPTAEVEMLDPFLLLDHMGPVTWEPGEAIGAPDHPHRGFETVTYLLDGYMEHRDSVGHVAKLGPGDVQWMTAGAGVIHSEMPQASFRRSGGKVNGFQLWVNLPKNAKMSEPRYQELRTRVTESEDGKTKVRVIAGQALGVTASIETRTPIFYLHFTLEPGARHTQATPAEYNTFAYVAEGSLSLEDQAGRTTRVEEGEAAVLDADGDSIVLTNAGDQKAEVLLIGGVPLNEPVARYGPFVMNTTQELRQAFTDYQSGRMGRINPGVSR